jgi:hypothetical protein
MHSPADYRDGLGQSIIDEVMCRCLNQATFGTDLDNEENDVPLYDQYNRGLTLCEEGLERNPLELEGARPGMTGYIPSMEEALEMYPASSPRPKTLVLDLGTAPEEELILSQKRRGLLR